MEVPDRLFPAATDASIAIIGAGCRYPGGVTDLPSLHRLLRDGVDAIREIPADRWSIPAFASQSPGVPGKTYSRWGGFIDHIADFEPEAFGISAREAAVMDPQQRLLLEVVWEALEDASIPLQELAGSRTGVFVGISTFDYSQMQAAVESKRSLQSFTALGTSLSIAANRLSYCLDLRGPSFIVDTACSSSLVALDRAVRSLQSGECDAAIVGGVNALLTPDVFVSFCAAAMLSPDGRCKAFDASANGFVRAEGASALILRSATAARSHGDRIHARILGSGVNQDGRTTGLAMPNGEAQASLLREIYARIEVSPSAVGYVEAHGTGTAVGDPIEAQAIGEVFAAGRDAAAPLIIGSIKTNIGHLEAASGLAGVLKAVLSLKHRTIYRNLHFHQPSPRIPFERLKLRVPVTTEQWPATGAPALAAVNSFGFGGTNAHVVLAEEIAQPAPVSASFSTRSNLGYLLPITARSAAGLATLAAAYIEFLPERNDVELAAICRTAAMRRTHDTHRLCVVGKNAEDLTVRIDASARGESNIGVATGVVHAPNRPIVFVFSGQGSQYAQMGMELLRNEPLFRDMARYCDAEIAKHLGWSVLSEIECEPGSSRIDETFVAQPALFTLQVALAALWQSWGVKPSAVIGHSVGEVAAAWLSGALELETACHVIAVRSAAMQQAQRGGKMVATALNRDEALRRIRRFNGSLALAAINSSKQVTISGDSGAIEILAEELKRDEIWHRLLQVSHAFHSSAMDSAEAPLRNGLNGVSSANPRLRFISTVTGNDVRGGDLNTEYWWRNVRQPVLFEQAARAMMADASPIFLEIGPHPAMSASLMECARAENAEAVVVPSLRRGVNAYSALAESVAGLFVQGAALDWNVLQPGTSEPVELPHQPWARERYWHVDGETAAALIPQRFHPLLGFRQQAAAATWNQQLDFASFPWLAHHRVKGSTVLPGAAFVELMLAAGAQIGDAEADTALCLRNVQFQRALFLTAESPLAIQVVASADDHTMSIFSRPGNVDHSPWVRHATTDWNRSVAMRPAPIDLDVLRGRCLEQMSVEETYQRFQRAGLEYGSSFRANRGLWKGRNEALAYIESDALTPDGLDSWWCHPTILDACFQLCCAPLEDKLLEVLKLPVGADQVRIWDRCPNRVWCHAVLKEATEYSILSDLYIYDEHGSLLAELLGFRLLRAAGAGSTADHSKLKTYSQRWLPKPIEQSDAAPNVPQTWVICADAGDISDQLTRRLENRGLRTIRLARASDVSELLPKEQVGILYCRGLDVANDFADDVLRCITEPISILRYFATQDRFVPAAFAFVTHAARRVLSDEKPHRFAAAALLGLGRVAANEFPACRFQLIDLPEVPAAADLDGAAESIFTGSSEMESAWRNATRYVPRLEEGPSVDEWTRDASGVEAFRLVCPGSGALDALQWVASQRSTPGPGEVEIEVEHAALNFRDLMKCLGIYPASRPEELELGDECAGVITAVGKDVLEFQVGDKVACCAAGSFQSHVVASSNSLFRLEGGWTTSSAATIPIAFLTAWYALHTVGRLEAGEAALIHSASGGVGMAALQVAKAAGARILATAGTEEKRQHLRELGCELVMDSRSLTFSDEVRRHTSGRGVDIVLNSLAGEALLQSVALLAPYGRFLELGKRDLFSNAKLGLWPLRQNASFHAIDLGAVLQEKPILARQLFEELRSAFRNGTLQPLPFVVWPASQATAAFRSMSQGRHIGKLVLDMKDTSLQVVSRDVPRVRFRENATYIVTGGASGFGLETAKWISRCGGRHIVLLNRRSPESEIVQDALAKLQAVGAQPIALSCDVADRTQLHEALHQNLANLPPIRGVFHAAAVIDDAALLNLDEARIAAVLRPKALGAWNLHEETRHLPLDHFVLFSSVSSTVGNPGQASYAAANALLEGLAEYRQSIGLPALAVGWGFVEDTGFAAERATLIEQAERIGFHATHSAELLDILERLMARPQRNSVVGHFDWSAISRSLLNRRPSQGVLSSLVGDMSTDAGAAADGRIRETLKAAEPEQRLALLRTYLQAQIARTLRLTPERVNVDRPIVEMGLDSLMAIELASVIERDCATTMPSLTTSRDVTVNLLGREILGRMGYANTQRSNSAPAALGDAMASRCLLPLRAGGTQPPLICFHPIGGSVRGYKALTDALHPDIPVFGLQSRMLVGESEHASLAEIATAYTAELRRHFPEGPYWLFGYSLGGYLAANVAHNLEAAGQRVEFIGVADCPDWTVVTAGDMNQRLIDLIESSYQDAVSELPFLKPLSNSDRDSLSPLASRLIERPAEGAQTLMEWLENGRMSPNAPQKTIQTHIERMSRHLLLAAASPAIPVVESPLFVWQASRGFGHGADAWRRRDDLPVRIQIVEADHAALMAPPAVGEIARAINLAYAERRP